MKAAVLTLSDRAAWGEREDTSGPALRDLLVREGWEVERHAILPDEQDRIEQVLREWSDSGEVDVILTNGGTGFTARDRTPEATLAVVDRLVPGLPEAMRASGRALNPHAMLSRAAAGIRGRTLIVNLPGSPRGAVESLKVILPALPHAAQLLRGDVGSESGHAPPRRRHQA
ncbi:MAG TPA: MogA/MoaB family molybdenum cofactor biosynthesis protein [Anaerolineales bacterium]|nr:MogA/MoaB family molybdenum cofactor biosynthesis protein [Anaerolineales bacterium]